MEKRIILITGANGQLGLEIARTFLTETTSDFIWLGVRERRDRADALVRQFPQRTRCLTLEVTCADAWKQAVASVQKESGRLDVLVNNAGKHEDALLANMPFQSWSGILQANLDSVFHGCQAVLPAMISHRHGRIVNIASLSALLPPPGQTNYAAAKAGVLALTQSLAKEVARIGVTVNAVCPGYLETEAFSQQAPEELELLRQRIPMRRFGRPAEVAAAVFFLASAQASYITGSHLKIDGGLL